MAVVAPGLQQAELASLIESTHPIMTPQYPIRIFEVLTYRTALNAAEFGDLLGTETLGQKHDHVMLARCQTSALPCFLLAFSIT